MGSAFGMLHAAYRCRQGLHRSLPQDRVRAKTNLSSMAIGERAADSIIET